MIFHFEREKVIWLDIVIIPVLVVSVESGGLTVRAVPLFDCFQDTACDRVGGHCCCCYDIIPVEYSESNKRFILD